MIITLAMISKFIIYCIGSLAISIFPIYYWHKLLNKSINFRDKKIYIGIIFITVFGTFSSLYLNSSIKMVLTEIVMILLNYFLYTKDLRESALSTLMSWIVSMVSEIILATVVVVIFPNTDFTSLSLVKISLSNILISILCFIISKMKIFNIIYTKIYSITSNMKDQKLFSYVLVIMSIICIFTIFSYYDLPVLLTLIVNSIISLLYMIIIFQMFKAENDYQKIYDKYTTSLTSLKEYEQLMDKQKIDTHENKNQFLTIKAMILNKEKNIDKYIDSIVKEKLEYNEKLLHKLSKIPEGGLRAIIYTKLNKIEKLNIDYDMYLSKNIYGTDLLQLGDDLTLDICKIVGVFLDNAIEAVQDLDDREINIDMYMDENNLCIEISNNYSGTIEINSIDEAGYTTKSEGHGYGLSLVKEIINKSNILENEKQLTNDYFTQILKIKM